MGNKQEAAVWLMNKPLLGKLLYFHFFTVFSQSQTIPRSIWTHRRQLILKGHKQPDWINRCEKLNPLQGHAENIRAKLATSAWGLDPGLLPQPQRAFSECLWGSARSRLVWPHAFGAGRSVSEGWWSATTLQAKLSEPCSDPSQWQNLPSSGWGESAFEAVENPKAL